MYITAFFTSNGSPQTGLSPTVTIVDLMDNSTVVSSASMTEVGTGVYKYKFEGYNYKHEYSVICDGGGSLSNAERYKQGVNNEPSRFGGGGFIPPNYLKNFTTKDEELHKKIDELLSLRDDIEKVQDKNIEIQDIFKELMSDTLVKLKEPIDNFESKLNESNKDIISKLSKIEDSFSKDSVEARNIISSVKDSITFNNKKLIDSTKKELKSKIESVSNTMKNDLDSLSKFMKDKTSKFSSDTESKFKELKSEYSKYGKDFNDNLKNVSLELKNKSDNIVSSLDKTKEYIKKGILDVTHSINVEHQSINTNFSILDETTRSVSDIKEQLDKHESNLIKSMMDFNSKLSNIYEKISKKEDTDNLKKEFDTIINEFYGTVEKFNKKSDDKYKELEENLKKLATKRDINHTVVEINDKISEANKNEKNRTHNLSKKLESQNSKLKGEVDQLTNKMKRFIRKSKMGDLKFNTMD